MCNLDLTCDASKTSRAIIPSSATAGHPRNPNLAETVPSFICALTVNFGSCACCATTPSNWRTYSSALRIICESLTHFPSSLKTLTCAAECAMAPNSAMLSPAKSLVTAPTAKTSHQPASLPKRTTCSTTPAVSATGSVFAMAKTAVYPPRAAARVPVKTVSASSRPGSRK